MSRTAHPGASPPSFASHHPANVQTPRRPFNHHQGSSGDTGDTHDTVISLATGRKSSTTAPTTIAALSSGGSAPSVSSDAPSSNGSKTRSLGSRDSVQPRVVFGSGTVGRLPTELGRLRLSAPLIVSSPSRIGLARRIQTLIPNLTSRILDSAVTNVPTRVIEDAVARITDRDCVVSVGGGSAINLAKAICTTKKIPHICIPTTYSGSEVTPLLGASRGNDGRSFANRDSTTMPTVIIYDEDLTASPMKRFSAPSTIAPSALQDSSTRRGSRDDNASWSYLHLPGV